MTEQKARTLAKSSNSGRYALDSANGPDLSSGMHIDVWLGGRWIPGRIEYAEREYYFVDSNGAYCGLTTGMKVRLAE